MIETEICYMLHIRAKGDDQEFTGRKESVTLMTQLEVLGGQQYNTFSYNPKVMIVLIESGYIWDKMRNNRPDEYPKLLITILQNSDRKVMKEACCRQIIKYFGRQKN